MSNTTRATPCQSPLFGRHAPPETHIIPFIESLRTPSYVPLLFFFFLEHHLAQSVHVYNPLRLAQNWHRIIVLFPPVSTRVCLKPLVTSVTSPQPCRWSSECQSRSASPRLVCIVKRLAQGLLASHTHTHTHPLSLSLCPAGGHAINKCQSASPVFTPSHFSFELSRGPPDRDIKPR